MTKYNITVSPKAIKQLGQHVNFLSNINKNAAKTKYRQIMDGINSLTTMPKRCSFFNELYMPPNKYRKLPIDKYYLIIFRIQKDIVYIDYIFDVRQNNNVQ